MDTKGYIHCQHGTAVMESGQEDERGRPVLTMIDPYPCEEPKCRTTFRQAMNSPDGVELTDPRPGWRNELAQQREQIPQVLLEAGGRSLLKQDNPTARSLANAAEIARPVVIATLLALADYAEQITLLSCDRTSGPSLRILAEQMEEA